MTRVKSDMCNNKTEHHNFDRNGLSVVSDKRTADGSVTLSIRLQYNTASATTVCNILYTDSIKYYIHIHIVVCDNDSLYSTNILYKNNM